MLSTVLVFLVTLGFFLWWRSRPRNAPPSPGLALPVIGHFYLFKGDFMEQLESWRQRLGNIYSLQLGCDRCVVLNGYDLISEALVKNHENLLDRPSNFAHDVLDKNVGIASLGGSKWKEQRAFLQSTLRALGVGRNAVEERIKVEAEYLLATVEDLKGEPVDLTDLLAVCVTNVICGVTFSKRFNQYDEEILYWIHSQKRMIRLIGHSFMINFIPWLKYIPGDWFKYKELAEAVDKVRAVILKWTEKDKRKINVSDEAYEDVVQAFLTETERRKLQDERDTCFDEPNMISTASALFDGGTDTTTTSILFAVLYMINFPDMQAKLFQEIKDVVGTDKQPDLSDKNKLKFMSAFILETQRFAGVAFLTLDRVATKDFNIGGYTVTKGTVVKGSLDSVLKDKEIWGDPEVFRPERFLDDKGSIVTKKEFLPFGMGKRNCIGESLAKTELFLFISALVQKFEFLPEKDGELPTMKSLFGLGRSVTPFKVRAMLRMK